MRSTPGKTSVTSSDAGSCSWRGGRFSARGSVSVTNRRVSEPRFRTGVTTHPYRSRTHACSGLGARHRGELCPGAVLFRQQTAGEDKLFFMATGDDLQADREAVDA